MLTGVLQSNRISFYSQIKINKTVIEINSYNSVNIPTFALYFAKKKWGTIVLHILIPIEDYKVSFKA